MAGWADMYNKYPITFLFVSFLCAKVLMQAAPRGAVLTASTGVQETTCNLMKYLFLRKLTNKNVLQTKTFFTNRIS